MRKSRKDEEKDEIFHPWLLSCLYFQMQGIISAATDAGEDGVLQKGYGCDEKEMKEG